LHSKDSGIIRARHSDRRRWLRNWADPNVPPRSQTAGRADPLPKGRGMEFLSAVLIGFGVAGVLYVAYLFWTTQEK
jgi:hypothetical protein